MRNTQVLKDFVSRWNTSSVPCKELLYDYMPLCRSLLYEDEQLVRDVTSILKRNIEGWARLHSPIYSSLEGLVSKEVLVDKSRWYVDSMSAETQPMSTSGSTTGVPFSYLRWEPFLYPIEAENHYDMIMDEFGMPERPKVMYFFNTSMYDSSLDVTVREDSMNFMEHHGLKRRAEVHYPNFRRFQEERENYLGRLLFYLLEKKIDVIFAPGPTINAMCSKMKKVYKRMHRICRLMSNSNERLLPSDASFLMMGYAENVCDHMRCWDGGAGFWTCSHGTYHLMDNLSWCEEIDGKLVSTDYFSLPCPFVRYWNGDFCRITDTYKRCECGRLYRDFEFMESRPFSVKGRSILEVKNTIFALGIKGLKRVICSSDSIVVTTSVAVPESKMKIIREKHGLEFKFLVER
jgi:hypothetical protein